MTIERVSVDYVIVGAGSAGCVLAHRLSDNGRYRVLILEAGPSDRSPLAAFWTHLPIGYGKTYYDDRFNWKYYTEPEAALNGERSYWPRGRVLGGSSAINAMVWARGHPRDFDDWGAVANGWSWKEVAPVFKNLECWSGTPHALRGDAGPQAVYDMSQDVHPSCETYLQAARESGYPVVDDYNAASMEGASIYQITTHKGLRASSARAYLHTASGRANLDIQTDAMVTDLVWDGARVAGVRWRSKGQEYQVKAERDVVLAAGAIASPLILQRAGIGDPLLLAEHGIPLRRAAPQVGQNLQDHLGTDALYRSRVPTLNQELGPWLGRVRSAFKYLLARRGPLALSVNHAGGFIRSDPREQYPDLQLYYSPLSYSRADPGARRLAQPDTFPGFLLGTNPCRPTSRGSLRIRSRDPEDAPVIQPNYLATEHDRALTLAGMRVVRQLSEAPAFKAMIDEEIRPGLRCQSDEEMLAYIRECAWTVFHPCGTCRMGDDPARSVVDARLRVHGVPGLRVADASVFPNVTSGNTNAPSIMVGERASSLILEDAVKPL